MPDAAARCEQPIAFRDRLELKDVAFKYRASEDWVLKDINLTIARGSRIGIVGKTGCGKSTLVDVIMGLLHPTEGTLSVDGVAIDRGNVRGWQTHIAHVPQAIFLADSSIEENIAFGVPADQINRQRVREAARKAQIADIIESWSRQYQTHVGERGVRLSGGQRQRIGIARALYKQADVIIFDEATSALDYETERSVMQAVESLGEGLTILIIAHRIDTLKSCSKIVELEAGVVKRVGTYQDIVE
jgi:ATP-binding cassette subfamily B protein